jgi:hypothetical protein
MVCPVQWKTPSKYQAFFLFAGEKKKVGGGVSENK